ncbi:hypothetical protein MHYP_G00054580 [Metynnis hypsauchen]
MPPSPFHKQFSHIKFKTIQNQLWIADRTAHSVTRDNVGSCIPTNTSYESGRGVKLFTESNQLVFFRCHQIPDAAHLRVPFCFHTSLSFPLLSFPL